MNADLKAKVLGFSCNDPEVMKHIASINIHSLEELTNIHNYLLSKGIELKPINFSIYGNEYSYIVDCIETYEKAGKLSDIVKNPLLINSKGLLNNLKMRNGVGEVVASQEPIISEQPQIEPVSEQIISQVPQEPVIQITEPIEAPISEQSFEDNVEEFYSDNSAEEIDPISEILSKPQTIELNDDTLERYESLSDSIRRVLLTVYGLDEIPEAINTNLIKLVTNGVQDDAEIMYRAITFGKEVPVAEEGLLRSKIDEEIQYLKMDTYTLGDAA